jgi:translation initiation factor RLI1
LRKKQGLLSRKLGPFFRGIQALFGFQLIAIFNNRFRDLTGTEQILHLIALTLSSLAAVLIMTPAAYHRIAERGMVSRRFVDLASQLLTCAMLPLMLAIAMDVFLLARLILNDR